MNDTETKTAAEAAGPYREPAPPEQPLQFQSTDEEAWWKQVYLAYVQAPDRIADGERIMACREVADAAVKSLRARQVDLAKQTEHPDVNVFAPGDRVMLDGGIQCGRVVAVSSSGYYVRYYVRWDGDPPGTTQHYTAQQLRRI